MAIGIHVAHGNDGAVFEPERFDTVRQRFEARVRRLIRDCLRKRRIARHVVAQILDHLRRFMACEGAALMRIGVDVVAEIGKPVRVEHHESRHAAFPRAAAKFAQRIDGLLPRRLQRAALGFRQYQRRHMADFGGKYNLSH
jgi:hypothetical protein